MNLLELRQALHAVLGFRSDIPTASPDQIVEVALATAKRADDAEQELGKVHAALDEAGVPATRGGLVIKAGLAIGAVDRVRLLAEERTTTALRAELDAYRSRGLPPAEAPKPAAATWEGLQKIPGDYYTLSRLEVPGGWLYKTTTWSEYREYSRIILAQQVTFVPVGVPDGR